MKTIIVLALALQLSAVALAQTVSPPAAIPQVAEVRSGELHLQGYFWKPAGPGPFPAILFNHGSGADDPQHTAGRTMAEAAPILLRSFLNTVMPSFIFAGGARVFPPTKAHLRRTS